MSRTPSDKLHRLIRSLTKTEKRYIQLYMRKREDHDARYQQLFGVLAQMPEYKPDRVKKKVYGADTAEDKKYAVLKSYLYDLILRALQDFDEGGSVEIRLNRLLQSVAVLYRRSHYDDCADLLQKAARLAKQYEQFSHWIEVIAWKKQLAYVTMNVDYLNTHLENLNQEEVQVMAQLQNLAEYRRAFFGMYTTIKKEAVQRREDQLARLQSVLMTTDFEDANSARSHRARVLYYRTLNLHAYAKQDLESFYETGSILLQLIENQPHFLKESLTDYIATLSNYILACGLQQRYEEVQECLQKLRELVPNTADDQRKIHYLYYTNRFAMCHFSGQFEAARADITICEAEAAELPHLERDTTHFSLQHCYSCFGCADYDAALDHLNDWLNQPRTVAREDLQSLARIVELILHYELGNHVLLDSLLRNTRRYMQQKNRFLELEKRFMLMMKQLVKAAATVEKVAIFRQLQSEWPQLPGALVIGQTFDVASWLESKVNHQSFAAIVQQKWRSSQRK
jgi:hypothetical protein